MKPGKRGLLLLIVVALLLVLAAVGCNNGSNTGAPNQSQTATPAVIPTATAMPTPTPLPVEVTRTADYVEDVVLPEFVSSEIPEKVEAVTQQYSGEWMDFTIYGEELNITLPRLFWVDASTWFSSNGCNSIELNEYSRPGDDCTQEAVEEGQLTFSPYFTNCVWYADQTLECKWLGYEKDDELYFKLDAEAGVYNFSVTSLHTVLMLEEALEFLGYPMPPVVEFHGYYTVNLEP